MISSLPFHQRLAIKYIDKTKTKLSKIVGDGENKLNYAAAAGLIAMNEVD